MKKRIRLSIIIRIKGKKFRITKPAFAMARS